jgi:hypothetical protein
MYSKIMRGRHVPPVRTGSFVTSMVSVMRYLEPAPEAKVMSPTTTGVESVMKPVVGLKYAWTKPTMATSPTEQT